MSDNADKTQLGRRKFIRKVGSVAIGGTVAAKIMSSPASAYTQGDRVTDGNGDNQVSVFAQPDASSNYRGQANGGPYNPPFGTVEAGGRYDPQADAYFARVDWDYGGDPDGWCIRNGLSPVNVP